MALVFVLNSLCHERRKQYFHKLVSFQMKPENPVDHELLLSLCKELLRYGSFLCFEYNGRSRALSAIRLSS